MSATKDTEVLTNILLNLVTNPDDVKVTRSIDEQGVLLSVQVASIDMPIVIGRGGSMTSAIRTVMRAVGRANDMNIRVQFLEPNGENRQERMQASRPNTQSQDSPSSQSVDDDLAEFVIN